MSDFFYRKGPSLRNLSSFYFENFDWETRFVGVGNNNQSYQFKNLPSEVQQFIRNEEVQKSLQDTMSLVREIATKVNLIEEHLCAIGGRLNQMSHTQEMMMTSKAELALKLTDEREEVRRLAEQILDVKRALGTIA